MGYTHTPRSSALFSDSNPHKDTLSKPLPFHFLSPCTVDTTARGFEICFFFCFFIVSFPPSNTDVDFSSPSTPQCLLFTRSVNMCQVGKP